MNQRRQQQKPQRMAGPQRVIAMTARADVILHFKAGKSGYALLSWDVGKKHGIVAPRVGDKIELSVDRQMDPSGLPTSMRGEVVDAGVRGMATSMNGLHCQMIASKYDYLVRWINR